MIKRYLSAAAMCLAIAAPVQAQQYSGLYVFGDSLSDSGNLFGLTGGTTPPSPPLFQRTLLRRPGLG
ncbi:MAG: hypothetical protein HN793_01885 [Rhodospirillaceae bacterium]|jgi:phospholipase/lecithinase/hemolysin|nr:hypothetical protein [Rhodospirillaceae bacterium]MBT5564219.1 hypothetical protein [Rhodospirillaceae bacterium]MBT6088784.1 hypothetical protein [Rhodospirillaceae bacterium]MBT7449552.1 hypothetical protein [Rhodospirillaceae bacterium]